VLKKVIVEKDFFSWIKFNETKFFLKKEKTKKESMLIIDSLENNLSDFADGIAINCGVIPRSSMSEDFRKTIEGIENSLNKRHDSR